MANHRLLRPGFFINPGVSTLKIKERYLLIGLTAVANDWGKFWYQPSHIRSEVFPTDEIGVDEINEMLDNIVSRGFICVYKENGVAYAHFPMWRKQGSFLMQYLNKPRPDIDLPDCPTHKKEDSETLPGNFPESSSAIEKNGKKKNKSEKKGKQEENIAEILNTPLVMAMSERYHEVDVSHYRDKYILYYKSRKHNITDHRRNFEKWLLEEAKNNTENKWYEDETDSFEME